jgi:hypothetical protein
MQIGSALAGRMLSDVPAPSSRTRDHVVAKTLALALLALAVIPPCLPAQAIGPTAVVNAPMAAPAWAAAQRDLIQLNAEAVRVHRARQFDARSLAPPQWGVGASARRHAGRGSRFIPTPWNAFRGRGRRSGETSHSINLEVRL